MTLARNQFRAPVTPRGEAVILFSVGGAGFAIAATAVDEIRNTDGLRPVAHSPAGRNSVPKVRHVLEREGRTYIVVDASYHFRMLPARASRVLLLRGRDVAVLVEGIDRMAEIAAIYALPRAFTGEERQWYRGLALIGTTESEVRVVPVVNPEAFLGEEERQIMRKLLQARGASA